MKYFSTTYTDFIKFDKKPNEDFYLISEKLPICVIADGVTQSQFKTGEYSFPAGAQTAAKIFCYTVLEFLEENFKNRNFKDLIKNAFDSANQKIKKFNIAEGIDKRLNYLEYDWFDCVGVAGFIIENNLYYGYVGDCGLSLFDCENKLKLKTKDMVKPSIEKAKKIYTDWNNFQKEKRSLIMRKEFRNRIDGNGYGSFTGESGVKKYYKIGTQKLESKDLIIFHSDGFLNYLKFLEFIEILRKQDKIALDKFTFKKASQSYEKYGTDRTLIAIQF